MQKSESDNSRKLIEENTRLNQKEYEENKIVLQSYPRAIFIQLDAPCNQDCLFCSRPEVYSHFDLDEYKASFEDKLKPVLERVERINLTGSGELLFLPEAKKILNYFNQFQYAEKMFATNGSSLTPKMIDYIAESGNKYVIHVSLHSHNKDVHTRMTASKHFEVVYSNICHLREVRKKSDNIQLNLIYLLTTKNIDEFPEFINFASDFNPNAIIAYYNYVYRPDQKKLSCYFVKEKTNKILDTAIKLSQEKNIKVVLPPKFGENTSLNEQVCNEAWSQVMVNPREDIITCDVAGDSHETLRGKEFMDVWNGEYYTKIRKLLVSKKNDCAKYCFRANPNAVNDFRSHIITRGKNQKEIDEFLEGT